MTEKEVEKEGEIEHAEDDEESSDDSMPELEPAQDGSGEAKGADGQAGSKPNKSEKKSRKAIQKLGLKPAGEFTRVTLKKSKAALFVIDKPEVYKGAGDTYIVFGEAKIEDLSGLKQAQAAQEIAPTPVELPASELPVAVDDVDDSAEVSEEGLSNDDIELVMTQGKVSRQKAVKALHANKGDVVNTIMALSG
eukprot:c52166_g1_i1.p1 GENE.c52166_g1_i1~~c52166_g1_i1.p1  ORF type:complete len:203 (-),score=63.82 c52166_g1_i1:81-659(-)